MRPPLAQKAVIIRTTLSLRPDDDADLVAAFASIPPRKYAAFIKMAMRSGNLAIFGAVDGQDDSELEQSLADFLD